MKADASASHGAKRTRSPSYPAVSLDVAIQRAKKLYDQEGRNAAPISAIAAHWGFKPGTSSSNLSVASLKKFGLLSDEGSRDNRLARLTELALDILLNPEPADSIRRAALNPRIHQELYETYGASLPSDASLRHQLIMSRNFTESGAADFIKQFRRTLTFAHLDGELVDQEETPASEDDVADVQAPEPTSKSHQSGHAPAEPASPHTQTTGVSIPLPLVGGQTVTLSGDFPISEAAWEQLNQVLAALKPGLVVTSDVTSDR